MTPIECHSRADLARRITLLIEKMGGVTLIGEDRENLCRRSTAPEAQASGGAQWVVEAQGLPNLIHEVVHALYLGRLADDHGFDYGQIPLDLERLDHRQHLWEELSCCVLSTVVCAPFESDPNRFALEWFTEQFEIQGVFHGLEHDLAGFRRRVDELLEDAERRAEWLATAARGRASLAQALQLPSLPPCDPLAVWRRYRNAWLLDQSGPRPGCA